MWVAWGCVAGLFLLPLHRTGATAATTVEMPDPNDSSLSPEIAEMIRLHQQRQKLIDKLRAGNEEMDATIEGLRQEQATLAAVTAEQQAVIQQLKEEISAAFPPAPLAGVGAKEGDVQQHADEVNNEVVDLLAKQVDELTRETAGRHAHAEKWREKFQGQVDELEASLPVSASSSTPATDDNAQRRQQRRPSKSLSRRLAAECSNDGPALDVEGVCSCSADVYVGNWSVTERLRAIEESIEGYQPPCDYTLFPSPVVVGTLAGDDVIGAAEVKLSSNGSLAFVVRDNTISGSDDLSILRLSAASEEDQPPTLTLLSTSSLGTAHARDLVVSPADTHVFLTGFDASELSVVDVTDPRNPVRTGVFTSGHMEGAGGMALNADGSVIYVAGGKDASVFVLDVADYAQDPTEIGSYVTAEDAPDDERIDAPRGLALSPDEHYLFVATFGNHALTVFDVSNPAAPAVVGKLVDTTDLSGAYDVEVSPDGRYAYVIAQAAETLVVVDVSDPSSPTKVATLPSSGAFDYPLSLAMSKDGSLAFINGYDSHSVAVVSVQQPTNPTLVMDISDPENLYGAWGVDTNGDYAVVAARLGESVTLVDLWTSYCYTP